MEHHPEAIVFVYKSIALHTMSFLTYKMEIYRIIMITLSTDPSALQQYNFDYTSFSMHN